MRREIGFYKAWSVIVPLGKGANFEHPNEGKGAGALSQYVFMRVDRMSKSYSWV